MSNHFRRTGRWREIHPEVIPRLLALLNAEVDARGRLPESARAAIIEDGETLLVELDRDSVILGFGIDARIAQVGTLLTGPRLSLVSRAELRRVTYKPVIRGAT